MMRSGFASGIRKYRRDSAWFVPKWTRASPENLLEVERELGIQLPPDLAWLLSTVGAGFYCGVRVYSAVPSDDPRVLDLRRCQGDLPPGHLAFADTGTGAWFAVEVDEGIATDTVVSVDHAEWTARYMASEDDEMPMPPESRFAHLRTTVSPAPYEGVLDCIWTCGLANPGFVQRVPRPRWRAW